MLKIKEYFLNFKKFGLLYTLKKSLKDLVLGVINKLCKILGIDIYSEIQYPFVNIKVKVKFQDFYWKKIQKGKIELNCFKCFKEIVKKGQTILDIGAWIGTYTLLLSKLVGVDGRIIAFEPDPLSWTILNKNIELNELKNITTEKLILSNLIGKSNLYFQGSGGNSLSSITYYDKSIKNSNKIIINTTTIDNYCEVKNIHPDGIKIDVEGAERLVLEGSQKIILKNHPWILLEVHLHMISNKEKRKIWEIITKFAKEIYFINENDISNINHYQYGEKIINQFISFAQKERREHFNPNIRNINILIKT